MRIFVSAGEPSGDLHGANLIRQLRRLHPDVECVGFGGERMREAGCDLLFPLCEFAVMWFLRVLLNLHRFLALLSQADRYFAHHRPDAVVLIDYPGFHWWLARRARARGIPVLYFVPPQLWGWASWRVKKMQRYVDHVLCSLPFEEEWYRERGVRAHYVGHPYFDELPSQRVDRAFLDAERARGGRVVAILPGSRTQEVTRNFKTLARAAALIRERVPDARFLVASFKPRQKQMVEDYLRGKGLPIEAHVGRTTEIIRLAEACLSVSGSVSLELLYHAKPTVIVYRIGKLDLKVCNYFKTSRFITLVNLLAGEELFPEYLTDRCVAAEASAHVARWLSEPESVAEIRERLHALKGKVAAAGACERTARYIVERLRPGTHVEPPRSLAV